MASFAIGATVLQPFQGGTGISSYTTGDIIYSDATTSLAVLGIGSTDEVLTVAGGVPTWAAGGAGSGDVTGVGDCADGACLDGSSDGGTYVRLYDGDSNYAELNLGDISSDYTVYLPITTGTLIHTEADPTVDTAAEILAIIDNTALDFGTGVLTATGFIGPLTGNVTGTASTATALAADPSDCAANNYAYAINASGTLTCSTIDISASTNLTAGRSLTLTDDDVLADSELYTDTKCVYWEDPVATDDFQSIWYSEKAITITRLWCESDQTVNMTIQEDDGSPADIETTDLVCDSTPADQTSGFEDAAIAAGSRIDFAVASATGTPTWASFCWSFTYDD